jgi:hypothetical protein
MLIVRFECSRPDMASLRSALKWLTTSPGLALVASAVAIAVAVVEPDARWLALPGLGVFVLIVARVADAGSTRTRVLRADLTAAVDAARADLTAAVDAARADLEGRLEAEVGESESQVNGRITESIDTLRARITSAIERERSVRSLSIAKSLGGDDEPVRVLLLMTMHRSGSTRLFDIFRTHPATRIEPTVAVWDALGMRGRRYPVAFSDLPKSWRAIEVEHDKGATIAEIPQADLSVVGAPWALEKAHPEFCDFDVDRFAERVAAMRAGGIEVEVVYGVRRPIDAMWSMVAFQLRQPTWYARLGIVDLPTWIERSVSTMADMREQVPGAVIDFDDLPDGGVVRSIATRLAPGWSDDDVDQWARFATDATSLNRPQAAGTGFLGGSAESGGSDGPNGAWAGLGSVMAAADDAYARLRADAG